MSKVRMAGMALCVAAAACLSGCSAQGAAWTSVRIGKNILKKDSYLRIWLDGHEARQSKLKKAYFGYASFKVRETVSTRPTFKYEFIDPKRFGRITGTNMQIHQEFEADFSHQPEFIVFPRKDDAEHLLKPGVEYDLGHVSPQLKVLNFEKQDVDGVELRPGMDYLLVFTVSGDRSETVQVLFSTK